MTRNDSIPARCKDLVAELTDCGWSFVLNHGKDTGENPYINIEARRGDQHIYVTWHTRATGTYRLFTCLSNKRQTTFARAMEVVAHE
jgi:hypothetical protein